MKQQPNPATKPLLFVISIFVTLITTSFLSKAIKSEKLKKIDFLSDVTIDSLQVDSEHSFKTKQVVTDIPHIRNFKNYNGIVSYENKGAYALSKFVHALKDLKQGKRKKVRVAYFGDSIIEGDLISQDLRRLLQEHFGGSGVGFVPITSIVSRFRQTIGHTYSSNWKDHNFKKAAAKDHLFLSGHYFIPNGASTVRYSVSSLPLLREFKRAFLLYGRSTSPVHIEVNQKNIKLAAPGLCNKQLVDSSCQVLAATCFTAAPLYGFSFEDEGGVYVDNFSFRGITGIELEQLNDALLKSVQSVHDYDLIIFQYGPNLLFRPKLDDFTWYAKPMQAIVQKFSSAFPNASVLVVSTADKAFKYNGKYETAKGVEPLLETQYSVALKTQTNLWNLYHAMGGRNSMRSWVNGDTALANKDYTHFNHLGARRVGHMLFNALIKEYEAAK